MQSRELKFIGERTVEFWQFSSYLKDGKKKARRLLTDKEITKAQEAMASQDEYEIDNFCYSIA